jgi:hypothetical protein
MLDELVSCFLDLFKGRVLPAGSAVVMFSVTHLMMRGLSGYVADMSREMGKLDSLCPGYPHLSKRVRQQGRHYGNA